MRLVVPSSKTDAGETARVMADKDIEGGSSGDREVSFTVTKELGPTWMVRAESENSLISRVSLPSVFKSFAMTRSKKK